MSLETELTAPTTLLEQLQWRYATKQFDPNLKIPAEEWAALEQSLLLAPSSFGLQPWKFFIVENPVVRGELQAHSWGQAQVKDASHFVVLAQRLDLTSADVDRYLQRIAEVRNSTPDSLAGFRQMMVGFVDGLRTKGTLNDWTARQVYIALGQFMTAAALLGVDTCPMEGLDAAKYDEVLGLRAQGFATVCAVAAGYRAATDAYAVLPKVRFPLSEVVQHI